MNRITIFAEILVVAFAMVAFGDVFPATVLPSIQEPDSCWTNKAGRVVWDFGRDAFGNIQLSGVSGQESGVGGEIWLGEKLTEDGEAIDRNPPGSVRAAQWPLKPDKRNTGNNAVKLPPELGVVMPFRYAEADPGVTVLRVMVGRRNPRSQSRKV